MKYPTKKQMIAKAYEYGEMLKKDFIGQKGAISIDDAIEDYLTGYSDAIKDLKLKNKLK